MDVTTFLNVSQSFPFGNLYLNLKWSPYLFLLLFGHFRRFLAFFENLGHLPVKCKRARLNNFFECESIIPFWQFIVEHVPLNVKWSPSFFWHQPFGLCARSLKGLSSNRPSQGRYQKHYLNVPQNLLFAPLKRKCSIWM